MYTRVRPDAAQQTSLSYVESGFGWRETLLFSIASRQPLGSIHPFTREIQGTFPGEKAPYSKPDTFKYDGGLAYIQLYLHTHTSQ